MRPIQLLASLALGAVLMFYPFFLIWQGKVQHGFAAFCMLVMATGFAGGLGFTPHHRIARLAVSPVLFWLGLAVICFYNFYYAK